MPQIIGSAWEARQIIENMADGATELGIDLETTGLRPHAGDKIFALTLATPGLEYYFDFNEEHSREALRFGDIMPFMQEKLFSRENLLWIGHNIKFDLSFLRAAGYDLFGPLWCTQTMARVERNDHMSYSLDACAQRMGQAKDMAVKSWCDDNDAYTWVAIEGKKTRDKLYHFERVPRNIMAPYACKDARLAYDLYLRQNQTFQEIEKQKTKSVFQAVKLEMGVTKIVSSMELRGIRVDRDYCEKAAAYERDRMSEAAERWASLTGDKLVDSAKSLGPAFKRLGVDPGKTEKGNDSFTTEVLLRHRTNPGVAAILDFRDAKKRLGTYFSSFLHFSQWDGRIHCSLNQAGTATGRFSSSDPNLQNLTDDEKSGTQYPIRRAFVADDNCLLLSADYQQMEYRVMLDYAQQMDVIAQVLSGKDLHQACAEIMGVDRQTAKTINFMLLYGGGTQKLADMLGCSYDKAQELRQKYFLALPQVTEFVRTVIRTAEDRGYIFNWMGRRYYFSHDFAYKAPNYLIQGGCSDVMRHALIGVKNQVIRFSPENYLQLQIHDELVLNVAKDTLLELSEAVKKEMIAAYPSRHLTMDVGLAAGQNLHDLESVDTYALIQAVKIDVEQFTRQLLGGL